MNGGRDRTLIVAAASSIAAVAAQQRQQALFLLEEDEIDGNVLREIITLMSNDNIPKCESYYENVIPAMRFSTFRSHFRITPDTFEVILQTISDKPEFNKRPQNLGGQTQVNPEKSFLIALWTLATPESYRSIGDRFNVTKSTVLLCLNTIVDCINRYLTSKFIKWPDGNERGHIAQAFQGYGMPAVMGAIDGCHVPIKRPTENGQDYYNRNKFYSVVLQAIAKKNLMFTDADVSWPGSVHDARVFRTSDIFRVGQGLCEPNFYIIGDSAYPCISWLMSPFRNNGHLDQRQLYFNSTLSKTRVVIENSFALLKGRFRRLKDRLDRNNIQDICNTIIACCCLHNICLFYGGEEIEDFIREGREDHHIPMQMGPINYNNAQGEARRNQLTNIIWNNRLQR